VLVRRFSPIESVVQTDQDSGCGRFRADAATGGTDSSEGVVYIAIVRAEVHVVGFQKRRPAWCEHPFNAATNRPACFGAGKTANVSTVYGDICTVPSPDGAALSVKQPAGCEPIADAARQGVEPIIIDVNPDPVAVEDACPIPAQACPIQHIAKAKHPSAGILIIAANLTAASKARIVRGEFSKIEIRVGAAKYSADVAADVASRPSNWSRRRCHVGRSRSSS